MSAPLYAADGLFGRLVAAAPEPWRAYTEHAFVRGLADGSLPRAAFQRYLVQDYLFLVHFCRAYGLAIYKTVELADMRAFQATLDAILNHEMALHVAYSAEWGLSERDLVETPEHPANLAYTRFVLDCGLAGDLLDLAVALSPCVVGYAVIGRALAASAVPTTPYGKWIDAYAGAEYAEVAQGAVALLDRLWARRGGPARQAELARLFARACELERDFWQMGLTG
ncbi:MAG TPA: thiaminase II [Candidatus Sulfotelmatobacter sp.]|nr:thiaminase II [Candidatus Sulfotelmatobacter sp.]